MTRFRKWNTEVYTLRELAARLTELIEERPHLADQAVLVPDGNYDDCAICEVNPTAQGVELNGIWPNR